MVIELEKDNVKNSESMIQVDLSSKKRLATIVYVLQIGLWIGIIPFFIAVLINYIKLSSVKNTWIESHFRWQIKTFWIFPIGVVVGGILGFISTFVGKMIWLFAACFIIYRIYKGLSLLKKNVAIPDKWLL
jgi:uncharacterized membrane protein